MDLVFSRWTTPIRWTLDEHGRQHFVELENRISGASHDHHYRTRGPKGGPVQGIYGTQAEQLRYRCGEHTQNPAAIGKPPCRGKRHTDAAGR